AGAKLDGAQQVIGLDHVGGPAVERGGPAGIPDFAQDEPAGVGVGGLQFEAVGGVAGEAHAVVGIALGTAFGRAEGGAAAGQQHGVARVNFQPVNLAELLLRVGQHLGVVDDPGAGQHVGILVDVQAARVRVDLLELGAEGPVLGDGDGVADVQQVVPGAVAVAFDP